MKTCPNPELIERYAFGFLEEREAADVRAHLNECAGCAKRADALDAEAARLAMAAKQVRIPVVARPRRATPWLFLAGFAAAAALLCVGLGAANYEKSAAPALAQRDPAEGHYGWRSGDRDVAGITLAPEDARSENSTGHAATITTRVPVPEPKIGTFGPKPVAKPEPVKPDPSFHGYGTNPFVKTADDIKSTFSLDVDTGSYTVMRRYLTEGRLPPVDAIRVEEFLNFFRYKDAAPDGETFAIHLEAAPSRFGKGLHLLRVGIKAKEIAKKDRMPAVLTFVIDTSGSMEENGRLEMVKAALNLLVDQLGEGDLVGIVKYTDDATVVLEHTDNKDAIKKALEPLHPENSTNAEAGIRLGYQLAGKKFRKESINRVILCSDGVANVGRTGPDEILQLIGDQKAKGVTLTSIGVGMGTYNDTLLEQLANKGNGGYHYIDDLKEAKRVFVEQLTGTLQTVAMDARVQVEFDPAVVVKHRLIGYENRKMANEDFRNDKKDAGEVGAGHNVVALYEVELAEGAKDADRLVKVVVRYCEPDTKKMAEHTRGLARGAVKKEFRGATLNYQLSAIVAEFAEILRKSPHAEGATLEGVAGEAGRLAKELQQDDVTELVELVKKARGLRR
jgi:Ca-activated chloride channel family protein